MSTTKPPLVAPRVDLVNSLPTGRKVHIMSENEVYIGIWTNWSKGSVLGLTLTVENINGIVLIAALALIVKWAGAHFWGILCFSIHQWRSTQHSRDGLHYQQQVLLRAGTSEGDLLWRMYEIAFAWRSSVPASFRRSLALASLALINLLVWLIAGIFSASVTATGGEALLVGKCGWMTMTANKDFPLWTQQDWEDGDALFVSAYNGYRDSMTYTTTCYNSFRNSTDSRCKLPTVPYIESTFNHDAPCPFESSICAGPTVTMDSGLIDSDIQLGINGPSKDRLQLRKESSCVPIPIESYSSGWSEEPAPGTEMFMPLMIPNDTYNYYSLGSSWLFGMPVSNFTFVYSNYSVGVSTLPYNLNVRTFYPKNLTESGFYPIAELNRTDADVSLLILNNRVAYTGRVNDPFFRASRQEEFNRLEDSWISNTTLTGLACTEQYQFCNPAKSIDSEDRCTPLESLYDFDTTTPPASLGLNPRQTATYLIMNKMMYAMRFNSFLMFLKNEILVASRLVYGSFGISTPLPDNQWQTEVANIHNVSLAGLQLNAIGHASTPNIQIRPGLNLHDHMIDETEPESQALCKSQRARIAAYSSFSMLGIIIILCCSFLIILVDYCLPSLCLRHNSASWESAMARQAWDEDDVLQLQRQALEHRGIGPWKSGNRDVPVIETWDLKFRRDRGYPGFDDDQQHSESALVSKGMFDPISGASSQTALEMKTPTSSFLRV